MNVERLRKDNRRPFITVSDFKLLTEKPFPKGGHLSVMPECYKKADFPPHMVTLLICWVLKQFPYCICSEYIWNNLDSTKSRLNIFPCCQITGLKWSHEKDMIIFHTKLLSENSRLLQGKGVIAAPPGGELEPGWRGQWRYSTCAKVQLPWQPKLSWFLKDKTFQQKLDEYPKDGYSYMSMNRLLRHSYIKLSSQVKVCFHI